MFNVLKDAGNNTNTNYNMTAPAEGSSQIAHLEAVLRDVLDPQVPSDRKRELERVLQDFKESSGAWEQCVGFLQHSNNNHVLWFALSVFEFIVSQRWTSIQDAQCAQIREFIYSYTTQKFDSLNAVVRNKCLKVYADLGMQDWPHKFPTFLDSITTLIQNPDTATLGIMMLQTAAEELTNANSVPARRYEELQHFLREQVPGLLSILLQLLDKLYGQANSEAARRALDRRLPTNLGMPATPFGSPTGVGTPPNGQVTSPEPLPAIMADFHKFFRFGEKEEKLAELTLSCICQFFSWIDLSQNVTPELLSTLSNYAKLKDDCNGNIGAMAVNCFSEILVRNCVPRNFDEYLLELLNHTKDLLRRITEATDSTNNPIEELADGYNEKFVDFLGQVISSHFRRVESNPAFGIDEFLMLLFRFTFLQPTTDGFAACLDVCETFIDVLMLASEDKQTEAGILKYEECLVMLATELLKKIRFAFNQGELTRVCSDADDGNGSEEWEELVTECTNILAQISRLFPAQIVAIVAPQAQEHLHMFSQLRDHIIIENNTPRLNIPAEHQNSMFVMCKDLSTSLQVLSRLSFCFLDEFEARFDMTAGLLDQITKLVLFCQEQKLYLVDKQLVDVHVQALTTLVGFMQWLVKFTEVAGTHGDTAFAQYKEFVVMIANLTVKCFEGDSPPVVVDAAALLLDALVQILRPPFLLEIASITSMMDAIGPLCARLQGDTRLLVSSSLSCAMIIPLRMLPPNQLDWESRAKKHEVAINALFNDFKMLQSQPGFATGAVGAEGFNCIKISCKLLSKLAQSIREQPKLTKEVFVKSIDSTLPAVILLLRIFTGNLEVQDEVLSMFLSLFEGIGARLGAPFIQQTIDAFLSVFTPEHLTNMVTGGARSNGLQTFLRILCLFLQDRSAVFKGYIPQIVSLCVDRIYPIVEAQPTAVGVRLVLFDVFKLILSEHWRFFFPSKRRDHSVAMPQMENQQCFLAIMHAFCLSFQQTDINLFKQNLSTLKELNEHQKIFQKDVFRENLQQGFLETLFQAMFSGAFKLLHDQILSVIHDLAAVDFNNFFSVFLPQMLHQLNGLNDAQKHELAARFPPVTDIPTFTHNVNVFVNDATIYQRINRGA
eukprot:m.232075 g.232075  ORF g.232075 m.232075 type:complete len:1118 (-) comp16015_c0_seq11:2348-5701(-)